MVRFWFLAGVLALAGCGDDAGHADASHPVDAAIDADLVDARITFDNLIDTGLCVDAGCTQIVPTALAYTPRWHLWSDTATKRRWITLPPGTRIDTADMDYWQFPIGTKLWKEFTRDGVRVETRLIQKIGPFPDDWFMTPYIWNGGQDLAVSTPPGMADANGTMHDVPSRAECRQCHDRQNGEVLGFGAIQLDYAGPPGELDLADLVAMNLLTAPPAGSPPYFPVPGSAVEIEALGYLHAQCGHCHNPTSDVFGIADVDLRMRVGLLATTAATPTYTSTINVAATLPPVNGATTRVAPQNLADSVLYQRFITTNQSQRMPRIGTEMIDPTGQAIIEAWINGLPP